MKKNINLGIQYALCLLLLGFYGCKSEERGETDYSVKTEVGGVLFSLQERDFGADVETGTRATELAKPQTMDLGEGLEAEVSVEQEAALAETRASKPLSNGTYTIVAFKDGTRIGQKLTATVSGGNLSITSNGVRPQFSWLTDGTYTFVCYNDKVTDDGAHSFTVTREDVAQALFDVQDVQISGADKQVKFALKHPGARVKTRFVVQMPLPNDVDATLKGTSSSDVPQKRAYDATVKGYVNSGTGSEVSTNYLCKASGTVGDYEVENVVSTSEDYQYFLSGTKCNKLTLNITSGKIYDKTATTASPLIGTLNNALVFADNASYIINIKLNYAYTYLFSDGSTGLFRDKPAGTVAIGLVVDKMNHIAVALKDVSKTDARGAWLVADPGTPFNKSELGTFAACMADKNGYNWTWDEETTATGYFGTVKMKKGESTEDGLGGYRYFGAAGTVFKKQLVADLTAKGVVLGNDIKDRKWYLPSMGEWADAFKTLGFGDVAAFTDWNAEAPWYYRMVDAAFKKDGGASPLNKEYATSTQYNSSPVAWGAEGVLIQIGAKKAKFMRSLTYAGPEYQVRPFIKYKD